jgi:hypothetical protein
MVSVKSLDVDPMVSRETARIHHRHRLLEAFYDASLQQHRGLDVLVGHVGAADCGQPQHRSSTESSCSHLFKVTVPLTARGGHAECYEYCTLSADISASNDFYSKLSWFKTWLIESSCYRKILVLELY